MENQNYELNEEETEILKMVVADLCKKNYQSDFFKSEEYGDMTDDIRRVIEEYEASTQTTMTMPSDETFMKPYIVLAGEGLEESYKSIVFYLWFDHRESDLAIKMELIHMPGSNIVVNFKDILPF